MKSSSTMKRSSRSSPSDMKSIMHQYELARKAKIHQAKIQRLPQQQQEEFYEEEKKERKKNSNYTCNKKKSFTRKKKKERP